MGRTVDSVPFRSYGVEIRERQPINPNPRYDGGKAQDCHREKARSPLAKSKPIKEINHCKSVENHKIRTDKCIKMVILQTEW